MNRFSILLSNIYRLAHQQTDCECVRWRCQFNEKWKILYTFYFILLRTKRKMMTIEEKQREREKNRKKRKRNIIIVNSIEMCPGYTKYQLKMVCRWRKNCMINKNLNSTLSHRCHKYKLKNVAIKCRQTSECGSWVSQPATAHIFQRDKWQKSSMWQQ